MDLGAPQQGFSVARRRIRSRTLLERVSAASLGTRSPSSYRRKPARCQPIMVSGFTIRSTFFQPGQKRRSVIQNRRPNPVRGRRRDRFRFEDCELLSESDHVKRGVSARAKEHSDSTEETCEHIENEPLFVPPRGSQDTICWTHRKLIIKITTRSGDRHPLRMDELPPTGKNVSIESVKLPPSPNLNACAERFVRTIKNPARSG